MIKTWGPICSMEPDGPHARMAETPLGGWVLYEDVKHLLPPDLQRKKQPSAFEQSCPPLWPSETVNEQA